MRIGICAGSYTARATAAADEEAINLYCETPQTQGVEAPLKAYGGAAASQIKNLFGTPGLGLFATLAGVPQGMCWTGKRMFAVGGGQLVELATDGTKTVRGAVANDGAAVSIEFSAIQLLICSGGKAYCYTLATDALVEVTGQLAGVPVKAQYSDGYFIVMFRNSNQFQISAILDGTNWPGIQVNEVSVFQEDLSSIIVNHRELWVYGTMHAQPYQDTGSLEVYDVIPGALIEKGSGATFAPCRVDNSVFWIDQDERGGRAAWRSNGYTPQRISTPPVEDDLGSYSVATAEAIVTYSYQQGGHLFWVLYIPGAQWSWVYDVAEQLWHKRAEWIGAAWTSHWSWNHVYAFGKHLVGDWNSGNIYWMDAQFLDDNGTAIRRLRRTPHTINEMEWIYASQLVIDFNPGFAPQPPLLDGDGNPRPAQAMLSWSDDRGQTWGNEHIVSLGMAGEYKTRSIVRRLGRFRYRVWEISMSDPYPVCVIDAYLKATGD